MLRSFWRLRTELNQTQSSSRSHHTGVTYGPPSGISVAKWAKVGLLNRSRYFSGMAADMTGSFQLLLFLPLDAPAGSVGREEAEQGIGLAMIKAFHCFGSLGKGQALL